MMRDGEARTWRVQASREIKRRSPGGPSSGTIGPRTGPMARLELESQRELDVAHLVLGRGAGDLSRVGPRIGQGSDRVVGLAEVHVVEEVDDLHAELEVGVGAR